MNLVQVPIFWEGGNNPEYLHVLNDYVLLTKNYQKKQPEFLGGMPVTLENDCFKQLIRTDSDKKFVYHITLKVDGERYLLFLSSYGSLYFIDRRLNFYIFVDSSGSRLPAFNAEIVKPFLFDGELVQFKNGDFEFLIFDVLFYQGESFIEQTYDIRLDVIVQSIQKVNIQWNK